MYLLSRRVRIQLDPYDSGPDPAGPGAFYELEVRCAGRPDPMTGYLVNISAIDEAVRTRAVGTLQEAGRRWASGARQPAGAVLAEILAALQPALGGIVASVRWWLSPYHWLLIEATTMDRVQICRQFEFSAAHRLHCPDLSDEANRRVFGKCNNPSGHGHNYKLEAVVSVPIADDGGGLGFARLADLVEAHVVRRFDHKHLNLDAPEFAGLNPTVEHIARVCHDLLAGPVAEAGGTLVRVTVWETDKTACTYPAGAPAS
jgi:6-pyruvoyltetrahydropterin/6-carboxytetrahydropterin synthase